MKAAKLSNNKRRQLVSLADQAKSRLQGKHYAAADQLCNQADKIYKDHPEIMNVRGLISLLKGDNTSALKWLSSAAEAAPKQIEIQANYAGCLILCGQEEQALEIYPKVVQELPRQGEVHLGYATALAAAGEYRLAIKVLEHGLSINPKHLRMYKKLADIYNDLGETENSIDLMEKARQLSPDNIDILFDTAIYLIGQGNIESGRNFLKQVIERNPQHINALSLLANSSKEGNDATLALIRQVYDQSEAGSQLHVTAAYTLGNAAESHGDYEQAFGLWQEANAQRRKTFTYEASSVKSMHDAIIAAFPASRFTPTPDAGISTSGTSPVFIVGTPRSGSTLLERALIHHHDLSSIGEIDVIEQAIVGRKRKVRDQQPLEMMLSSDNTLLREVGFEIQRRLQEEHRIAGRAVCKALNYYMYAGLIAVAMPGARIIHIKRNPLAACLSMFKEDFGSSQPYSYDLEEMGQRYQWYDAMIQHWRQALPEHVMLETSYESLVSDPEPELRRILAFCNLEWDPACLATHEAKGTVATASLIQVRQPIHKKSIARWKHYEEQLAPLMKFVKDQVT
ncbi:Tetratricopeptide repeat-containing protein [Mariprofundus ferrinatatus]|uniref:Tetratricopeptide repeat-containing protein n=1 Tax=Mariprofundus ferrinatatus TaxID=1921087 RepID=A0A2K8LAU2_9PROT|nr:tetratricopeptide repeat-containing sulfotransferase family protein [Mariprofundus ferrinatatus]ATX83021.1 Tetratricopeptide repeat-containing protein [Mariprofundus ferrinatatus]